MRNQRLSFLCLIVAMLVAVGTAQANRNGITGRSTTGCANCHGNQSANTTVSVDGPRTVQRGATVDYTVIIAHQNNAGGGFNAAIRGQAGNAGTIVAGDGSRVQGGEITHVQPKNKAGADVRFPFQWTAPQAHGVYALTAAGNAVNLDQQDTDADDWNLSGTINITVPGATFTAPVAGASVCAGQDLVITWTQTGYQSFRIEYRDGPTGQWQAIGQATANAGTITWSVPGDAVPGSQYQVRIVTATQQGQEVVQESATFTVNAQTTIVQQPRDTTVCLNRAFSLTVGASGTNNQYRWKKDGVAIAGATNAVLSITLAKASDAGTYSCEVFGCGTVETNTVTVTVLQPPSITQQPEDLTVCLGDSIYMEVRAQGAGLRYQWFKNGAPIQAGTRMRYSITLSQLLDAGQYYCEVRGDCAPVVRTDTIRVHVREKPAVTSSPQDRTVEAGTTLVLGVRAVGELMGYQWLRSGEYIQGANSDTLRIANITLADSGLYECQVINNCGQAISTPARIRVVPSGGPSNLVLRSDTLLVTGFPFCRPNDVTSEGLLQNLGGSALRITSITTSNQSLIEVLSQASLPATIAPGASEDLTLKISPVNDSRVEGTVTFFTNSGNRTLVVIIDADPGFTPGVDSILVPAGGQRCVTFTNRCSTPVSVSSLTLAGPDAGDFTIVDAPSLPFTVAGGESREFCVRTDATTGTFSLEVGTRQSSVDIVVVVPGRANVVSSVSHTLAGTVSIAPNPAADVITITADDDSFDAVSIITSLGQPVVSVEGGTGPRSVALRTADGMPLAPGMYMVVLRRSGNVVRTLPMMIAR